MERLYFTFGSDPKFPYGRGDFVIAVGKDTQECIDTFKKKYPNREPDTRILNCADYYDQAHWDKVKDQYYKDVQPKEILVSDTVYGKKPEGFAPIWFWVPYLGILVFLQEGSGDNLLPEDEEEGNVDYLDYTCYSLDCGEVNEGDGGQLLLPYMVQEHYGCLADAIPDILDFEYEEMFADAQILERPKKEG